MSRPKPGEESARFMEMRGRRVTEAAGAFWHNVEGRLYMSLPYHLVFDPDPDELERMLRSARGLGVRYPSNHRPGLARGLYVCRDRDYAISSVNTRLRSRVRRGLERCETRAVDPAELLDRGLRLNLDTMKRQGRYDPEFGEPRRWRRLVRAIQQSPCVSSVGAFVDGDLAAYMIVCREDGWFHILHQMSRQNLLKHRPNHALTFSVTRQEMRNPETHTVCYGAMSLAPAEGLHEYKLRLGYEVAPHASVIQLHPLFAPVLTSGLAARAVRIAQRIRRRDQRLDRVSAVLQGARLHYRTRKHEAPAPVSGLAPSRPGTEVRREV